MPPSKQQNNLDQTSPGSETKREPKCQGKCPSSLKWTLVVVHSLVVLLLGLLLFISIFMIYFGDSDFKPTRPWSSGKTWEEMSN